MVIATDIIEERLDKNMTNEITVQGTQEFMGKEIPIVYGGFGEGQKVVLAKTIAEIHGMNVGNINQRINDNRNRFKDGIDIIDLNTSDVFKEFVQEHNLKTSNRTKNIYLLSERGYAKLIKIMDSDKAWEVHDKLMDEYFSMRQVIENSDYLKSQLLLTIYNGGQDGILASRKLTELEVEEATKPLLETIEEQKPCVDYVEAVTASNDSLLVRQVAKICYKDAGIKIGEKKLYKKLREWKWVCKNSTEPTQYALNQGYLEVHSYIANTPYGEKEVSTTMVKPKGQIHIIQRLMKEAKGE